MERCRASVELLLTVPVIDEYLSTDYDVSRCSYKLFTSGIFAAHADYVRRQIIYGLLQEDDPNTLHLIAAFLLFDGRQNEIPLQMMNEEGAFARLLELIQALRKDEMDGGAGLHRLCMDLLYEMSRIQRIKIEDLGKVWLLDRKFFFVLSVLFRADVGLNSARGR